MSDQPPVRFHDLDRYIFRTETSTQESDEKLLWKADTAIVQATQATITKMSAPVLVTPAGCDTLERLVELRSLHQTRRAAHSVRSRHGSGTREPQDAQDVATPVAIKRQKLCAQMADVLRRSSTGLERSTRWRSAPGTMDPDGVSELNGNSANAEVVAKNRVKAVSHSLSYCLTHLFYNATPRH